MPKKGKGRGKGRGTPAEHTASVPEGGRRPGAEGSVGRGRGQGQVQPPAQAARQSTSRDEAVTPTVGSVTPDPEPGVQRTATHPFFDVQGGLAQDTKEAEVSTKASHKEKKFEKTEKELVSKLTGLSFEYKDQRNFTMAKRPNYAMIDERSKIPLYVNYFRLTFKDTVVYHYDIDISDATKENKIGKSVLSQGRTLKEDIEHKVKHVERQKRRNMGKAKCREIISEFFRTNASFRRFCPVYDGQKNLFTSQALPCKEKTEFPVDIAMEGRTKRFFVSIAPVKKKDTTNVISLEPLREIYAGRSSEIPSEVLLVFETVMNHREAPFNQVHFRNAFYYLNSRDRSHLGSGLEIWRGYHQNVQLTKLGPVVVINLAAKAFHKSGPVIDYACEVLNTDIRNAPRLRQYEVKSLSEALRGVQIQVTHQRQPRKYKIKGVTELPASEIVLDFNKRRISVAQYFFEQYRKKLEYPNLPCLHMHSSNNSTFIPMETCEVTEGQPKIGKLSAELTSTMIRSTAVEPKKRKEFIGKTAAEVNNMSEKYMRAFGLLMDIKFMQVDGRIIAAPQIKYAGPENDCIAKPDTRGVWRVEGGKKFFKPAKIDNWTLISFADRRRFSIEILNKYCQFLVNSARKCGMILNRPQCIETYGREMSTEQALLKVKKSGAQMAIVVLNRRDMHHTYDEVKFLADFKYNLVTQCMEDKTLLRINDQITTNVCLKINVKLGGINHVLYQKHKVFSRPVIVFGVDAIHWTRGYGYPSIVSVVGSLNPSATQYALKCELQRNDKEDKVSQEIIKKMKEIAIVILKKFREVNGVDPVRIVVFRDGVSDGQFQHALEYEVSGLQKACEAMYGGTILPITYMVVQKRHQTRLFPVKPNQGIGKNLNVPAGTCVDKEITHPVYWDYFICSHEGIQGTSRPAHYTILHDDNKFTSEELQQLCYFLCHTYVRCTRSVSLPAPVMYADLAAARAKKYADLFITSDSASSTGSDSVQRNLPPNVEKAIREMESFENNMFYV